LLLLAFDAKVAATLDFEAIVMQTELTRSLLEGIPMPIVLIGTDTWVRSANESALGLLGRGIIGRPYQMGMRQPSLATAIDECLANRMVSVARCVFQSAAGEQVFRVRVAPVEGGALCAFEDISEAEQIGQMRRDFVANVSHELRSPLTALLGFIETLQGPARDDAAARARFLGVMSREAGRMNRLVSDLLSLSRVEADKRVRPTAMVDISTLTQRVVATLRPLASESGVELVMAGVDSPKIIPADPDQITQVLHNLIENAIKYAGQGPVTIRLTNEDRDAMLRGSVLRIDVQDRGEGIDDVHLPRLTERFYRVDSHRSREKGGTGLGLAIVKHIVNRHRGRLTIESKRGEGSLFSIYLPNS
jgi:two-component system phosphate regulon sensor histidine kinase PhoR